MSSEPSALQPISQDVNEAQRGQKAALEDIERGELSLVAHGRPGPSFVKYAELLRQRYGVEAGGGCVQVEARAYVEEYNRVMRAEIAERFGADALEEAWAEATE